MKRPNGYWTLEHCKEDALGFSHRGQWCNNSVGYQVAYKNSWLEECCGHMKKLRKSWSLEKCQQDALQFKTRIEWCNAPTGGYAAAHRKGWLEECCKHMKYLQLPKDYWTLERCKEEALKYKTRTEWKRNNSPCHAAAYKKDWLEKCCAHMKMSSTSSLDETTLLDAIKRQFPKTQKLRTLTKKFFPDKPLIHAFDIDIYIPELRKGIEFNGTYWHSTEGLARSRLPLGWPQEDIDNYHKLKKDFFTAKGIEYIEIWEKDWKENPQQCIEKCLAFLGT